MQSQQSRRTRSLRQPITGAAEIRIGRRAFGIPAAIALEVAHEIVHIRVAERVFVGSHSGAAFADLLFDAVFRCRPSGEQLLALEYGLQVRRALWPGEFVVAEPALVIEDFAPAVGTALRCLLEFVDRERTLIGIARRRVDRGWCGAR